MRHMAVVRIRSCIVPVLEPLLKLPALANHIGRQSLPRARQFFQQRRIGREHSAGFNGVGEQVTQDLPVHGGSRTQGRTERMGVLGRERG